MKKLIFMIGGFSSTICLANSITPEEVFEAGRISARPIPLQYALIFG